MKNDVIKDDENQHTISNPEVDMKLHQIRYSQEQYELRRKLWQEESVPLLENAPRTYFDMVVATPDRLNILILFKFIEGFKSQISYQVIPIDKRDKCNRTSMSSFDRYSYKDLFEFSDLENTVSFKSTVRIDLADRDSVREHDILKKVAKFTQCALHHKSIVQTLNDIVEESSMNVFSDDIVSIKDCLNLNNVHIFDIESRSIVNEKLSDEFADKVQFALTMAWIIIARDDEFLSIK